MTVDYTYRPDGLRLSKRIGNVTTTHVWDGSHIVAERNQAGGVINRFDRGAGWRIIRSEHHGFYLYNVRGDVVQRSNASGAITHSYRYTAFGNELPNGQSAGTTTTNPSNNPWRFAGEYWDAHRGEYYLRARSFNPRTGRFTQQDPFWGIHNMQEDPLAIMQASNLFVFAINNPIRWLDPTGFDIRLTGYQEDRELILSYLQMLTNHTLGENDGLVFISSFATGDDLTLASGNALIERMIASEHTAYIMISGGANRNWAFGNNATIEGVGTISLVHFNPFSRPTVYTVDSYGISSRTAMPLHIMLGHELIHADRAMRGVMIPLEQTANISITRARSTLSPLRLHSQTKTTTHRNAQLEEWATIGLGHYTANCITENMLRREHGLMPRSSHRGFYR